MVWVVGEGEKPSGGVGGREVEAERCGGGTTREAPASDRGGEGEGVGV